MEYSGIPNLLYGLASVVSHSGSWAHFFNLCLRRYQIWGMYIDKSLNTTPVFYPCALSHTARSPTWMHGRSYGETWYTPYSLLNFIKQCVMPPTGKCYGSTSVWTTYLSSLHATIQLILASLTFRLTLLCWYVCALPLGMLESN